MKKFPLKKIANWFYRKKKEDTGRIRLRILFFVFKYWPNKRVRELLNAEAELANIKLEQAAAHQKNDAATCRWARERQIFDALEKYKHVPPYEPQGRKKADIPTNCIWQLWWQGEDQMPDIVRLCTDSVRRQNPDRRIIVLSKNNVDEYITVPDLILEKHARGIIDTIKLGNIIRLLLLAEYGGTWIDGTVYMSGPMPKEISESEYFTYINASWHALGKIPDNYEILFELQDKQRNPYVPFSNWFIHAKKGNRIVCKILAMHLAYWKENDTLIDYFLFHYLGTWALYGDDECRNIFNSSPWKSQIPAFAHLQPRLFSETSDEMLKAITQLSPIHKLTYKYGANASSVTYSFGEAPQPTPGNVLGAIYRSWRDGKPLYANALSNCRTPYNPVDCDNRRKNNLLLEKKLKQRVAEGNPIRVTFLVSMMNMFPARPLMEQMLTNSHYDVHIVIIPELRFGKEKAEFFRLEAERELSKYGERTLIANADPYKDNIRLKDFTDIVFLPVPYEDVSTPWYRPDALLNQDLLLAIVNYGFFRSTYDRELISWNIYQQFWKIFIETEYNLSEYQQFSPAKGANTILSGYVKMDDYAKFENVIRPHHKKTVLLAPHHSIEGGLNDMLALSNFMRYADLFLQLPEQYPDINFIFRPHPALFPVLERDTHWGKEKADEYIRQMKAHPNVRWSDSGNYFEDFAESDAIIQDCGSFLVDYFYTGKPQCYMLHSEKDIEEKFAPLGQKCLSNCYLAYEEAAIRDFMEEVIIKGNDPKKEARQKFAKEEIMLNYPNASAKAADLLYNILS